MKTITVRSAAKIGVLLLAAMILGASAILSFHAGIRHAVLSIVQGLYETQRQYALRRYLIEANFEVIADRLQRQLDTIAWIGSDKSESGSEFIKSMSQVIANVRSPEDFRHLKPVLQRLAKIEPRAYLPELWLAEAMLRTGDPAAGGQIERAISLMPADDRGYRLALELALDKENMERVAELCRQWPRAQQGGLRDGDNFGLFDGQSNRRFVLEGIDPKGVSVAAVHAGLNFQSRARYEFRFDRPVRSDRFRLHMAVFPGTRLNIHGIAFLERESWRGVSAGEWTVVASDAFFDRDGTLIMNQRGNQVVEFRMLRADKNAGGPVYGMEVDATFSKLRLIASPSCIDDRPE